MDKEPQQQPQFSITERNKGPEPIVLNPVEALPSMLGFTETAEQAQLRAQLTEAIKSGNEDVTELAARYHISAEDIINQIEQRSEYVNAQIGLIVQMGLINRAGGNIDSYLTQLEDAYYYAWNEGLDDLAATIQAAMEEAKAKSEEAVVPEAAEA